MAVAATDVLSLLMFIRHELPPRMGVAARGRCLAPRHLRRGIAAIDELRVVWCRAWLALLGVVMRSLRAVVYGIVVWDPAVILTYSVFVAVVCIAAASIPAWRAATISPVECLHS
jgi:ABC-type antimicrobial peptide transport system permease subunit